MFTTTEITNMMMKSNSFCKEKISSPTAMEKKRMPSYYFLTSDEKFVIQTISDKQRKLILKHVQSLYEHIRQKKTMSLLNVVYGVFQIAGSGFKAINFTISRNYAKAQSPLNQISLKFDLNGVLTRKSEVNPHVMSQTNFMGYLCRITLKNDDFINFMNLDSSILQISFPDRLKVLEGIQRDVHFLEKCGLIGYSLLLVIEEVNVIPSLKQIQQQQIVIGSEHQSNSYLFTSQRKFNINQT